MTPIDGTQALGLGSLTSLTEASGARIPEGDGAHVAKELEALFATMLVKEMRKGMAGEFFGEGSTGDIYGGWFDDHVGRSLSESGAFDLAGIIKVGVEGKDAARAASAAAEREEIEHGRP
jgi:Rod binding domain-containing protein